MAFDPKDLIVPVVSAVGAGVTSAISARRADSAHQREVRDLKKAGLNPVLSAMGGRGAEVGNISDPVEKGISSGLAARRMKAEIGLIEDQALLTRTQAGDIQQTWNAGKFRRMMSEAELAELSVQERRALLPLAYERAAAELKASLSSARAAEALAILNEARRTGELNRQEFEKRIGEAGPMVRFFLEILRGAR